MNRYKGKTGCHCNLSVLDVYKKCSCYTCPKSAAVAFLIPTTLNSTAMYAINPVKQWLYIASIAGGFTRWYWDLALYQIPMQQLIFIIQSIIAHSVNIDFQASLHFYTIYELFTIWMLAFNFIVAGPWRSSITSEIRTCTIQYPRLVKQKSLIQSRGKSGLKERKLKRWAHDLLTVTHLLYRFLYNANT